MRKDGTFINSERRIGAIKKVSRRAGRGPLGLRDLQARSPSIGAARHVRGLGFARRRVPDPEAAVARTARATSRQLSTSKCSRSEAGFNGRFPRARPTRPPIGGCSRTASFITRMARRGSSSKAPRPLTEPPSERYPLILLLTGRGNVAQWHTDTRTGKSAVLRSPVPEAPGRGNQPGGRPTVRHQPQRLDFCRVAARTGPSAGLPDADDRARPNLPADARRGDQSPDRCGLRPVLEAAGLQSMLGPDPQGERLTRGRSTSG